MYSIFSRRSGTGYARNMNKQRWQKLTKLQNRFHEEAVKYDVLQFLYAETGLPKGINSSLE
jgi:hypothetical protein